MAVDARAIEVGPVRVLSVWLPLPTWNKHNRVGTTRTGRRFLTPEARAYRDAVVAAVRPILPRRPWFDHDRPWYISYVQLLGGAGFDDDQWLGGIRDDLVEAGLVKDDACARTSRLVTRDNGPAGVFVIASQEVA